MKKKSRSDRHLTNEKTGAIWNKIGKDRLLICILGGLLLAIIAMPVDKKETGQSASTAKEKQDEKETETGGEKEAASEKIGESATGCEEYGEALAVRLENILKYMDGVGSVKVLVTMENTGEIVVEKDSPVNRSNTIEADAEGGSRNIADMENDEETVYVTDSQGNKTPYVVKKIAPMVKGVMVVAEGGGNTEVQNNIVQAVSALFDIAPEKIKVVKMKESRRQS